MFKKFPRRILGAATAVVALAVAGCTPMSSTSTPAGTERSGNVDAGFTAKVQASIDKAKAAQPPLRLDGPKAVAGKKVAIVSVTLAETGALRTAKALAEAAEAAGWSQTTYDGQGSPTTANQKLQQAVTTKPDGIVLVSLEPTDVGGGLKAAKDAGIPVTCAACWDLTAKDTKGPYYTDVQPDISVFQNLGYLTAQWAYLQTKGHPQFLTMTDPALSNLSARYVGFNRFLDECKAVGGDCALVAKKDFQVANATTTLPADAAALVRSNPSANAFWMTFDFAGLQALNGLRQAGLASNSSLFMVASNGDGPNLDIIKTDGFVKATVAVAFEQEAYAAIDNLNRLFAGQPLVKQTVPIRLFDKTNVSASQGGAWAGDVDYRAAYTKVWQGSA